MTTTKQAWTAVLILSAIVLWRLLPQLSQGSWRLENNKHLLQTDSVGYVDMAQSYIDQPGFFPLDRLGGIGRTPLFPAFIAFCLRWFGPNLFWVIFWQNFLQATVVFAIYKIGLLVTRSRWVSLLISSAWILDGSTLTYSSYIYTEPLYVFFSLWSIYLFIHYMETRSPRHALIAGLLWGITTLVRPIGVYTPIIFVSFILLDQNISLRERMKHAAIYMLSFWILIVPMLWRNKQISGQFQLSNQFARTLTELATSSIALRKGIPYDQAAAIFNQETQGNTYDEMARWEVRHHPFIYGRLYLQGVGMLLFTPGSRDFCSVMNIESSHFLTTGRYENPSGSFTQDVLKLVTHSPLRKNAYIFSYVLLLAAIYGFALYGLTYLLKGPDGIARRTQWLLLFITAYYIVVTGTLGTTRYRMPMMPIFCLLSAYGLLKFQRILKRP